MNPPVSFYQYILSTMVYLSETESKRNLWKLFIVDSYPINKDEKTCPFYDFWTYANPLKYGFLLNTSWFNKIYYVYNFIVTTRRDLVLYHNKDSNHTRVHVSVNPEELNNLAIHLEVQMRYG